MRPAAMLLTLEAEALRPILDDLTPDQFDRPTVCTGWSVRDVLAHCGAALSMTVTGSFHDFTPEENQQDVDVRRSWSIDAVIDELFAGYSGSAVAIDRAGGALDGIGVGEWMHGGDVREAVEAPDPYVSAGIDLAYDLLVDRSARLERPPLDLVVGDRHGHFGVPGAVVGTLETDLETFVRLCGGRRPDPLRFELTGAQAAELAVFD